MQGQTVQQQQQYTGPQPVSANQPQALFKSWRRPYKKRYSKSAERIMQNQTTVQNQQQQSLAPVQPLWLSNQNQPLFSGPQVPQQYQQMPMQYQAPFGAPQSFQQVQLTGNSQSTSSQGWFPSNAPKGNQTFANPHIRQDPHRGGGKMLIINPKSFDLSRSRRVNNNYNQKHHHDRKNGEFKNARGRADFKRNSRFGSSGSRFHSRFSPYSPDRSQVSASKYAGQMNNQAAPAWQPLQQFQTKMLSSIPTMSNAGIASQQSSKAQQNPPKSHRGKTLNMSRAGNSMDSEDLDFQNRLKASGIIQDPEKFQKDMIERTDDNIQNYHRWFQNKVTNQDLINIYAKDRLMEDQEAYKQAQMGKGLKIKQYQLKDFKVYVKTEIEKIQLKEEIFHIIKNFSPTAGAMFKGGEIEMKVNPEYRGKAMPNPIQYSNEEMEVIRAQLKVYEEAGFVRKRQEEDKVIYARTPLKAVFKADSNVRLVMDAREVNQFFSPARIALPSILQPFTEKGKKRWFCKIDFADAFMHLPLSKEFQKWFTFQFDGVDYFWTRMGFGWNMAPVIFHVVAQALAKEIREGYKLILPLIYYDDLLLVSSSKKVLKAAYSGIIHRLQACGIQINSGKCVPEPVEEITWLGFKLSPRGISLDYQARKNIERSYDQLTKGNRYIDILELFGRLQWAVQIMRHLQPEMSHIQNVIPAEIRLYRRRHYDQINPDYVNPIYGSLARLVDEVIDMGYFWLPKVHKQTIVVYTDASAKFYGYHCRTDPIQEQVSPNAPTREIGYHETYAIWRVVQKAPESINLVIKTDSQTAHYAIMRAASDSDHIRDLLQKILRTVKDKDISLVTEKIKGKENPADRPSRVAGIRPVTTWDQFFVPTNTTKQKLTYWDYMRWLQRYANEGVGSKARILVSMLSTKNFVQQLMDNFLEDIMETPELFEGVPGWIMSNAFLRYIQNISKWETIDPKHRDNLFAVEQRLIEQNLLDKREVEELAHTKLSEANFTDRLRRRVPITLTASKLAFGGYHGTKTEFYNALGIDLDKLTLEERLQGPIASSGIPRKKVSFNPQVRSSIAASQEVFKSEDYDGFNYKEECIFDAYAAEIDPHFAADQRMRMEKARLEYARKRKEERLKREQAEQEEQREQSEERKQEQIGEQPVPSPSVSSEGQSLPPKVNIHRYRPAPSHDDDYGFEDKEQRDDDEDPFYGYEDEEEDYYRRYRGRRDEDDDEEDEDDNFRGRQSRKFPHEKDPYVGMSESQTASAQQGIHQRLREEAQKANQEKQEMEAQLENLKSDFEKERLEMNKQVESLREKLNSKESKSSSEIGTETMPDREIGQLKQKLRETQTELIQEKEYNAQLWTQCEDVAEKALQQEDDLQRAKKELLQWENKFKVAEDIWEGERQKMQELMEAKGNEKKLKEQLANLNKEISQQKQQISQREFALQDEKAERQAMEDKLQQDIKVKVEELLRVRSQSAEQSKLIQDLGDSLQSEQVKVKELEEKLKSFVENDMQRAESEIASLKQDLEQEKEKRRQMETSLAEGKSLSELKEEELKDLSAAQQRADTEIKELRSKIKSKSAEVDSWQNHFLTLKLFLFNFNVQLDHPKEIKASTEKALSEFKRLKEQLDKTNDTILENMKMIDGRDEKLGRLEEKVKALKIEKLNMEQAEAKLRKHLQQKRDEVVQGEIKISEQRLKIDGLTVENESYRARLTLMEQKVHQFEMEKRQFFEKFAVGKESADAQREQQLQAMEWQMQQLTQQNGQLQSQVNAQYTEISIKQVESEQYKARVLELQAQVVGLQARVEKEGIELQRLQLVEQSLQHNAREGEVIWKMQALQYKQKYENARRKYKELVMVPTDYEDLEISWSQQLRDHHDKLASINKGLLQKLMQQELARRKENLEMQVLISDYDQSDVYIADLENMADWAVKETSHYKKENQMLMMESANNMWHFRFVEAKCRIMQQLNGKLKEQLVFAQSLLEWLVSQANEVKGNEKQLINVMVESIKRSAPQLILGEQTVQPQDIVNVAQQVTLQETNYMPITDPSSGAKLVPVDLSKEELEQIVAGTTETKNLKVEEIFPVLKTGETPRLQMHASTPHGETPRFVVIQNTMQKAEAVAGPQWMQTPGQAPQQFMTLAEKRMAEIENQRNARDARPVY